MMKVVIMMVTMMMMVVVIMMVTMTTMMVVVMAITLHNMITGCREVSSICSWLQYLNVFSHSDNLMKMQRISKRDHHPLDQLNREEQKI